MSNGIAWHREITSAQWKALLAAQLGWMPMLWMFSLCLRSHYAPSEFKIQSDYASDSPLLLFSLRQSAGSDRSDSRQNGKNASALDHDLDLLALFCRARPHRVL